MSFVVGIDASRTRSGGGKAHLIGVLSALDPLKHSIRHVHVWAYSSLLDSIPDKSWLVKHKPPTLEGSLLNQLIWQANCLSKEVKKAQCDILFTADASTLCFFKPMVVFSQDLLSYEPGVMKLFGYGYSRFRLLAILYLQNFAFRRAQGVIFLTRYAAKLIQQSSGLLTNFVYIPHGVDRIFQGISPKYPWPAIGERPIRCLYISNAAPYKHQWHVVKAIEILRKNGHDLVLELVGGSSGNVHKRLEKQIAKSDPEHTFISQKDFVPQNTLPKFLTQADLFIFASSCETFGITLLEAMTVGMPIACSNRSSLPETLQNGGVYFNPENPNDIAKAVEKLVNDADKRQWYTARAKELSRQYSWDRCARETFSFIVKTIMHSRKST